MGPEGRFWSPEAALDPEIAFRTRRLSEDPEVDGELEVPLDHEVVFRTLGSFREPVGRLGTWRSFRDPEVDWESGSSSRP